MRTIGRGDADAFAIDRTPHLQRARGGHTALGKVRHERPLLAGQLAMRQQPLRPGGGIGHQCVEGHDEQAFAEMNGAFIKFVEDAARLVYFELNADERIKDFQVACSHLESLHSHDAVSVICKGVKGGFRADFGDFRSLVC